MEYFQPPGPLPMPPPQGLQTTLKTTDMCYTDLFIQGKKYIYEKPHSYYLVRSCQSTINYFLLKDIHRINLHIWDLIYIYGTGSH